MHLYANNAQALLAAALDTGETTMTVDDASLFPEVLSGSGNGVPLTLTHSSLPDTYEVVLVTSTEGAPDLVVQRGYESDEQDWPIGTKVAANITARMLRVMLQQGADGVVRAPSGSSLVMGGSAASTTTSGSSSFVVNGRSRLARAVQVSGYPILQLARSANGGNIDVNFSRIHVGGTVPVDIGVPATWASGNFRRGSVVVPTTPDGYQYWLDIDDIEANSLTVSTEPAWPGDGSSVDITGGTWWAVETPADFLTDSMQGLIVTEVGFICQKYGGSAPPSVSIGTESNPTRYASAVSLTAINADKTIHRIPIADGGVAVDFEALRFQVTTPAATGRCLGRFYWHGFFVELDSAL